MSWLILSGQINLKAVCVVDEEQFCVFISKNMFWQKCCGKEVEDGMWDQTPRILVRKICHSCMRRTQNKGGSCKSNLLGNNFFFLCFWTLNMWSVRYAEKVTFWCAYFTNYCLKEHIHCGHCSHIPKVVKRSLYHGRDY